MNTLNLLFDGPAVAPRTIALAHGAGAPMDSEFMAAFADGLAKRGFRVARFEFPYMADRRRTGGKRPPDRAPVLVVTCTITRTIRRSSEAPGRRRAPLVMLQHHGAPRP